MGNTTKEDTASRFVWNPGDIVIIEDKKKPAKGADKNDTSKSA